MKFESFLKDLGLLDSEIRIYLYLLENGLSKPPQIEKGTKIARTNAYAILQRLKEKGLINEHKTGKRKAYIATDPIALEQSFERKRQAIHNMLPDLRALYAAEKNKPKIQYFEGWDQVKQIYDLTLSARIVFAFGSTEKLFGHDKKFFERHAKRVKDSGIVWHDILMQDSSAESIIEVKGIMKGFYDFKTIPRKYQDMPTDIMIWGNNIAFINLSEPVFGTIISNSALATSLQIVFDALWKKL
jgi:predicted transcriptional regulator